MDTNREIRIDSKVLARVRTLTASSSPWAKSFKSVAQFRLVIDANFAISDLMHKYRKPEDATAVEEMIRAAIFVVVAPRWLETEMIKSAIPQTAKKRNIPEPALMALWAEYEKNIVWDDACREPPVAADGVDPKDVPYVMTQVSQSASGVLSNDAHISRLGGTKLNLDFVLSVRRYARHMAVSVSVRFSGIALGMFTIGALIEGVKLVAAAFSKLPPVVQVIVVLVIAGLLSDPRSRAWLKEKATVFFKKAEPVFSFVGEAIVRGRETLVASELKAEISLCEAQGKIVSAQASAAPLMQMSEPTPAEAD